jgi:hypothetical protein
MSRSARIPRKQLPISGSVFHATEVWKPSIESISKRASVACLRFHMGLQNSCHSGGNHNAQKSYLCGCYFPLATLGTVNSVKPTICDVLYQVPGGPGWRWSPRMANGVVVVQCNATLLTGGYIRAWLGLQPLRQDPCHRLLEGLEDHRPCPDTPGSRTARRAFRFSIIALPVPC